MKLRTDTRGAVLVEFVIAIVPLLIAFFSFVQLAFVAEGRLAVKHAAIIGARAAAVYSRVSANNPGMSGDGKAEVTAGVNAAIAPWQSRGTITVNGVDVNDTSSMADPYGWVYVTVHAQFNCNVPLGRAICGGGSKVMNETYRMPHQGARYVTNN